MADTSDNLDDFRKLASGANLSFENAERLYFEAEILDKAGALSRALFLHQISIEECAKVDILTSWAFASVDGQKIDFNKIKTVISSHAQKNRANAYSLGMSDEELDASSEEAIAIFKRNQKAFHEQSNNAKNSSLYVNLVGSDFIPPEDAITKEMVTDITASNEKFLAHAYQAVKLMERFQASPSQYAGRFNRLKIALEKLKGKKQEVNVRELREMLNAILEEELKTKNSPE